MNFQNAERLNSSGPAIDLQGETLVLPTTTGSMWGKGNTCSDMILFPHELQRASVEVSLRFLPQFGGEQAGIVLYIDSDNYVKFVREMVDQKQVVVLAKEFAGEPSPELILPFESSAMKLRLHVQAESITVYWKPEGESDTEERTYPNWFKEDSEFRAGLFVHGNNPKNEATFSALNINGLLA